MKTVSPRDPKWVDTAPIIINEVVEIAASPQAAWDVLADNERWPEWFPGFRACRFLDDADAPGVGSVRFVHQDQFRVHERITAWTPGEAWGMTVIAMNLPVVAGMAENVRLRPLGDDTTELTFTIGVELKPWARPVKPMLVGKSRKQLKKALTALAGRAASGQTDTA